MGYFDFLLNLNLADLYFILSYLDFLLNLNLADLYFILGYFDFLLNFNRNLSLFNIWDFSLSYNWLAFKLNLMLDFLHFFFNVGRL